MEIKENDLTKFYIEKQISICEKYNADFLPTPFDKLIGVAIKSFEDFKEEPINGLRYPIENEQSANWYIWVGEYSDADTFFQPIHVSHLLAICPNVIKYLGLAPGWRFLFDDNYEDVWYDKNLICI
jgi:hypothetical protein